MNMTTAFEEYCVTRKSLKLTNNVKICESRCSLTKSKKNAVPNNEKNSKRHRPVNKNQLFDKLLDVEYVIDERKNKSKSICL